MDNWIVKQLRHHFHNPNYLFFLLSLVSLIIVPPLANLFTSGEVLLDIIFSIVIFMAALYTSNNIRELQVLLLIGTILFTLFIVNQYNDVFNFINAILTLIFFHLVLWNLIKYVLNSKLISANDIFASIAGYLVLGVVAASVFFVIESTLPGAFNIEGEANFYDFIYFSYITLTSVGYGDMLPVHPIAKAFSILLSISGQIYLTILIGIIIGKFLVAEERKILNAIKSDDKHDS